MPPRGVDLADMVARFGHQLHNLNDRFVLGDLTREEYLSQSRALKASLEVGRPQTTHGDDVLARAARLLARRSGARRGRWNRCGGPRWAQGSSATPWQSWRRSRHERPPAPRSSRFPIGIAVDVRSGGPRTS